MEAWIYLDRIDFHNATTLGESLLDELRTPIYPTGTKRVFVGATPNGMRSTILRARDLSEAEV